MNFEQNIDLLKVYLKRNGWFLFSETQLFEQYKNDLGIELRFPKIKDDPEYPNLYEISLKKIKKINPKLSDHPVMTLLLAQCKNMRQKYSKEKKEWILSEPNSKYNLNEIPDIYIPKNYIFEK